MTPITIDAEDLVMAFENHDAYVRHFLDRESGSVFFILALVVLFYSTFFFFFFVAELLDTWLWRWVAFLIVFALMVITTAVFALLGYLKVRRIRGPQQTIESVRETREALTPGHDRSPTKAVAQTNGSATPTPAPTDPSGW